ncbi:MAG: polyribonucleotide nucleotidyltransferase [Spirochaetes bacterium]|nr:polyribonucleotide nucleotidyltransferase [Spirochaetota bacterium]
MKKVSMKIRGEELVLETGRVAKQANGSVLASYGGTVIITAVTSSKEPVENIDYFPLIVNYQERIYAAGKIPGGFFKREGRPTDKETLIARIVDRPLRPLFPKGFRNEVQIIPTTLSADQVNPPDILAVIASSTALTISDIPFNNPVGAVRMGKVEGEFIINPTFQEMEKSDIDLIVAGTKDGITMVEGHSKEVSEDDMIQACQLAHAKIKEIVKLQEELVKDAGVKKMEPELFVVPDDLRTNVSAQIKAEMEKILKTPKEKKERKDLIEALYNKIIEKKENNFADVDEDDFPIYVNEVFDDTEKEIVRNMILENKKRIDGRGLKDIRDINCEVNVLPRTHGSSIFTRGQTQSMGIVTLGSVRDEQRFDDIEGEATKSFMLHYNFPPFSVGETGRVGSPSRREIGHGMLAERSLTSIIPDNTEFPYTIRVVSEILESNGSSSMASVCSACLALLDAGVPLKDSVAGIAMGLVYEDKKYAILTDILGEEDHLGDMDFKVAGTKNGITAFQMDIKIDSINFDIMKEALAQAKEARIFILDKMNKVLDKPRQNLSEYAPKIKVVSINPEKIAAVIGPGGRVIKDIIKKTDTDIFIDDEQFTVTVSGKQLDAVDKAIQMVKDISQELEIGKVYEGRVTKIMEFGAFVSLPGNREGLVHISKISKERVHKVQDVLKVGDQVKVKLTEIDSQGRYNLNMRDVKK